MRMNKYARLKRSGGEQSYTVPLLVLLEMGKFVRVKV
jgi:hypothetical protein